MIIKDRGKNEDKDEINKRILIITFLLFLIATPTVSAETVNNNVSMVWMTDAHCGGSNDCGEIVKVLTNANILNIDIFMETGDLINRNARTSDLNKIVDVCNKSGIPECYYTLGNHEVVAVGVEQWLKITGMEAINYSVDIDKAEWRLIVLNTQFYLAPFGLEWLKSAVNTTRRIIIFNHMPLDGSSDDLGNNVEVKRILESRGNVVAVFSGHNHKNTAIEIKGIWYFTQAPMINGAYSFVHFSNRNIQIIGYGTAASRNIPIPTPTINLTPAPTSTFTPTLEQTPTINLTPAPTSTFTPTPEQTPTINLTPAPTSTFTPTPEQTPTINLTPPPSSTKPVLISISPTSARVGDHIHFVVTGNNFDSEAVVEGLIPTQTIAMRTLLNIAWEADATVAKTYNVRVRNGNGQLSDKVLTFTVNPADTPP
jgi:hypothetical protein